MPSLCPRPCSRLVTAVVFIAVGVVQFIGGIILLRSKYVYLLAGPDFWTSGCNIIVGCFLGLAASVWKQSAKKQSSKHIQRTNVLNALIFSALTINGTTFGILLLGEGNALLSIQLENSRGNSESTLGSEVLAYAYAASVCSPIVCMVVSIVSITGRCFKIPPDDFKTPKDSLRKQKSLSFNWVYTPELLSLAKKKAQDLLTSSSEDESTDDSSSTYDANFYSADDIQRILRGLAEHDKRMEDSAALLKKLNQHRKKYYSTSRDGSYLGPDISISRKAMSDRRNASQDSLHYHSLPLKKALKYGNALALEKNVRLASVADVTQNELPDLRNGVLPNDRRRSYHGEIYNPRSSVENLPTRSKSYHTKLNSEEASRLSLSREQLHAEVVAAIHNANISKAKSVKKDFLEDGSFRQDGRDPSDINTPNTKSEDSTLKEATRDSVDSCFTPGNSAADDDSFAVQRSSSMAGEMVTINLNASNAPRSSVKLIPVKSPVVPDRVANDERNAAGSVDAQKNRSYSDPEENGSSKFGSFSSFKDYSKIQSKENMPECIKKGPSSVKKYDFNRVSAMESISEEPLVEQTASLKAKVPSITNSSKKYLKRKSVSIAFSDNAVASTSSGQNNSFHYTPKRKASTSKALRRIWSSTEPERVNFRDHVVDEDSLIGLSEEELIARQFRNRSIRKVIQNRIQAEIAI